MKKFETVFAAPPAPDSAKLISVEETDAVGRTIVNNFKLEMKISDKKMQAINIFALATGPLNNR